MKKLWLRVPWMIRALFWIAVLTVPMTILLWVLGPLIVADRCEDGQM